jgi:hypothetical protein
LPRWPEMKDGGTPCANFLSHESLSCWPSRRILISLHQCHDTKKSITGTVVESYMHIYIIYIYTRCTVSVWCLWNPASVFEYSRFSFLFSKLISWHVPIDQWQCRSLAIHLYLCEEVEIQVTQGLLEVGLPLWIAGVVAGELWPLWLMIRSYRGQSGLESHDQMTLEMTQVDESQVKNRRW